MVKAKAKKPAPKNEYGIKYRYEYTGEVTLSAENQVEAIKILREMLRGNGGTETSLSILECNVNA